MRGKLFLVHWNPPEAEHLARDLRAMNWRVDVESEDMAKARRKIRERAPDAVVISLARMPTYGVDFACALRASKTVVPILFLDGKDEVVQAAKARVSAALFTTTGRLAEALEAYARASWG